MSEVQWIKISTNVFDNQKIQLLETLPDGDSLIVIWFKLLAMAGKCNDSGLIYLTRDIPLDEEMLSALMRRPINTIRLALVHFEKMKMIEIINNFIAVVNWERHQNIDKLDKMKETSRITSQRYREKQRKLACDSHGDMTRDVTVTRGDTPDKNRIDKNRIDKRDMRFAPPSIEELTAYITERGIKTVNATTFLNHYQANGWMVGKNKMKDWKAAVRGWESRATSKEKPKMFKEQSAFLNSCTDEEKKALGSLLNNNILGITYEK